MELGVKERQGQLHGPGMREFAWLLANTHEVHIQNLCQVLSAAEHAPQVCPRGFLFHIRNETEPTQMMQTSTLTTFADLRVEVPLC